MSCEHREKTILYFYGEPAGGRAEAEAHLACCASCAADLAILGKLSAGFAARMPEPPLLRAADLAAAARGRPVWERFMAEFGRLALAGAAAAAFLLAFRTLSPEGAAAGWSGPDSLLDSMEYRIYSLQDDTAYSYSADFDYASAELESQNEKAAGA